MARPVIRVTSAVHRIERYPKTASVSFTRGDLVCFASGYLKRVINTSPKILGLWRDRDISSASSDYAENSMGSVEVDEMGIYEIDADATLVQATHVGNAYDLNDHDEVDLGASALDMVIVVGITPDGRALCKLNQWYGNGTA